MVSVVIPLYNKIRHIARAIDSVLAQTFADFELIVVDDGSTDGGADVVRSYADHRIRLVTQENAGVSVARNRGVEESRFDLVAFLDADDEWYPDFLETVLSLREKFPEAAIWGTAYVMMNFCGQVIPVPLHKDILTDHTGQLINFCRTSIPHQPIHSGSFIVLKQVLIKAGGFRAGLVSYEDTEVMFRVAIRYPIAFFPQPKMRYNLDAENRSDRYAYSGNYPFFASAKAFLAETKQKRLDDDILRYLAYRHTRSLPGNWLAGNRTAMLEILRDCHSIPGYRLTCLLWCVLCWFPPNIARFVWRMKRIATRFSWQLPPPKEVRSIYRT